MGFKHMMYKTILKNLCENYTQIRNVEDFEVLNTTDRSNILPKGGFKSQKEKEGYLKVFEIAKKSKINNRPEFRNFSLIDILRLTKGRFEVLCFISIHNGNKSNIYVYRNNYKIFEKDCEFVYEYIKEHAADAITLPFNEFMDEAYKTLDFA